jgi:predicted Rossmann fold nucleotide-binding protein DprA/Smf involved in DNA uptake
MEYLGNKDILHSHKVGFLCSRKVPASVVLKSYDWAKEQRRNEVCIISGNHSQIEKDIFQILLNGEQPLILVLARGIMKRIDAKLLKEVNKNRLLIIAPFGNDVKRITLKTAAKRNEVICDLANELIIGHISPNGVLFKKIKNQNIQYTLVSNQDMGYL